MMHQFKLIQAGKGIQVLEKLQLSTNTCQNILPQQATGQIIDIFSSC